RGRHRAERIRHPNLVRRRIEHERVRVVQPPPAGEDILALAELIRRRRPAKLDEPRVRPPAELEIASVHAMSLVNADCLEYAPRSGPAAVPRPPPRPAT